MALIELYSKAIDEYRQEHHILAKKEMSQPFKQDKDLDKGAENLLRKSALYKEFLAEREEILKHKWIESEKAGHDVGFEKALLDWIVRYRASWRRSRKNIHPPH